MNPVKINVYITMLPCRGNEWNESPLHLPWVTVHPTIQHPLLLIVAQISRIQQA